MTEKSISHFLLEFENFTIAGSSPEVMIRLVDGHLLLRPIAGTRKRGKTLEKDLEMENELIRTSIIHVLKETHGLTTKAYMINTNTF